MKLMSILCAAILAVTVLGCSAFTPPMEMPIIEDHSHDGRVTTFSTIPSRRMVILTEPEKGSGIFIVCAEPSADVSDNIASSMAAALTAKGPNKGTESSGNVGLSIANTLATTAQHLFKRTQGLQLYRDGMYNLCQAKMNGIIDNKTFQAKADVLLEKAVLLITKEIPYLDKTQPDNTQGTQTNSSSAEISSDGGTKAGIGGETSGS